MQRASAKALEGFKDWIEAAHHYRHEQGVETPSQPAEEIGVMPISHGVGYVRWLAQLDRVTDAEDVPRFVPISAPVEIGTKLT